MDSPNTDQGRNGLENLIRFAKNHQEFKQLQFKSYQDEFLRLVGEGQTPKALYIGCSDSRVVPDLLLGAQPGDLFIVRSAGNFVAPYDKNISYDGIAASIEYAIEVLNIKDVIVCGHSHCGAIAGLYTPEKLEKMAVINQWIRFGDKAKQVVKEKYPNLTDTIERNEMTARLSVLFQLDNLLSYPFIKEKVEAGTIHLHGWFFILEKGTVEYYDPEQGKFKSLRSMIKKSL